MTETFLAIPFMFVPFAERDCTVRNKKGYLTVPVVMTKEDIEYLDAKVKKALEELKITVDNSRGWPEYYQNGYKIGDSLKDEILQKYFKEQENGTQNS